MKENLTEEEKLRKIARERIDFKRHLVVYIVIIAILGLTNLIVSRDFPWILFPAGGWGIGLIFHFLYAYGPLSGAMSEEKEYQKLKKKQERNRSSK